MLATISAMMPESVVTVVSAGQTATALKMQRVGVSDLGETGEKGAERCGFRVSAASMNKPALGSTIMVAGESAIVVDVKTDLLGAWHTVEYQLARPVE